MSKKENVSIDVPTVNNVEEVENLREYANEAEQVALMTKTIGWSILKRDLTDYIARTSRELPYKDPKLPEYDRLRIMYLASDTLLKMVEDYEFNRAKAIEFINKLDNKQENIVLDVDN